jgi:hypothetical protein
MDAAASLAARQPQEAGVRNVPTTIDELEFAVAQREMKVPRESLQGPNHSGWQSAAEQLSCKP